MASNRGAMGTLDAKACAASIQASPLRSVGPSRHSERSAAKSCEVGLRGRRRPMVRCAPVGIAAAATAYVPDNALRAAIRARRRGRDRHVGSAAQVRAKAKVSARTLAGRVHSGGLFSGLVREATAHLPRWRVGRSARGLPDGGRAEPPCRSTCRLPRRGPVGKDARNPISAVKRSDCGRGQQDSYRSHRRRPRVERAARQSSEGGAPMCGVGGDVFCAYGSELHEAIALVRRRQRRCRAPTASVLVSPSTTRPPRGRSS